MKKILEFFIKSYKSVKWFILCFLTKDCPYSLKKLLAIFSFGIIAFVAIFTEKLDILIAMISLLTALLGLQSIDKYNYNKKNNTENLG